MARKFYVDTVYFSREYHWAVKFNVDTLNFYMECHRKFYVYIGYYSREYHSSVVTFLPNNKSTSSVGRR